jgi:hypothetical protein
MQKTPVGAVFIYLLSITYSPPFYTDFQGCIMVSAPFSVLNPSKQVVAYLYAGRLGVTFNLIRVKTVQTSVIFAPF